MVEDWTTAPVTPRIRAALGLLELMTVHPLDLDEARLAELCAQGELDSAAVYGVAAIGFHFNLMNRLADAFDFQVPDAKQRARMARLLNINGLHAGRFRVANEYVTGRDGRQRPPQLEQLREDLLSKPGLTEPDVRRQADHFVREQWGVVEPGTATVDAEVAPYLKKLALHAYRIMDEDMEALREHGLSDEAIYELTVTGAVSVACIGTEQVMAALEHRARREGQPAAPSAVSRH
ncbi:MAG: hypothetical protein AAF799_26090 [Myxococcota bacterium]